MIETYSADIFFILIEKKNENTFTFYKYVFVWFFGLDKVFELDGFFWIVWIGEIFWIGGIFWIGWIFLVRVLKNELNFGIFTQVPNLYSEVSYKCKKIKLPGNNQFSIKSSGWRGFQKVQKCGREVFIISVIASSEQLFDFWFIFKKLKNHILKNRPDPINKTLFWKLL